jgi:hypothetical protein
MLHPSSPCKLPRRASLPLHCRFHFDVTEAIYGHNVLGLPEPKLLMLAPGVQLFAESEGAFLEEVKLVSGIGCMGRSNRMTLSFEDRFDGTGLLCCS